VQDSVPGAGSTTYPHSPDLIWWKSYFRLEIDGIECKYVVKIDPFTIRQTALPPSLAGGRNPSQATVQVKFPNMRITLAQSSAQTWRDWLGNSARPEKTGHLVLLSPCSHPDSPPRDTELTRIDFAGLRILSVSAPQNNYVTAELACGKMALMQPVRQGPSR